MRTTRHIGRYTIHGKGDFWTVFGPPDAIGWRSPILNFGTLRQALAWCRANPPLWGESLVTTLARQQRAENAKRKAVAFTWHDEPTDPMSED